jgi:hypothetical protein
MTLAWSLIIMLWSVVAESLVVSIVVINPSIYNSLLCYLVMNIISEG